MPPMPAMPAMPAMPTITAVNHRHVLPATRRSCTHKFAIAGHEGYLTIGLFEDGSPGEIFIKMSKEGSTLSGLIQGFCRAFSLALQYGLSMQDAVDRFRGMRFDPMGPTSNPEIPEAASVLIGPAEMALTRMFLGPRSAARYRTHASSAAFATPMTL